MSGIDVRGLFGEVMKLSASDRLRMAADLLEAKRPDLVRIAVDVAKSALVDVELPLVSARLEESWKRLEDSRASR